MASGKDLACKILKKREPKAHIFHADKAAHQLYQPGSLTTRALVRHFGKEILRPNGAINRKKLGRIVFADPRKLKILNQLTHGLLKKMLAGEIQVARKKQIPLLMVNAALLHTIPIHTLVDFSWSITAPEPVRMTRLMKRRGLSSAEIQERIQAQRAIPFSCAKCRPIQNSGTAAQFVQKIRTAYNDMIRTWENSSSKPR